MFDQLLDDTSPIISFECFPPKTESGLLPLRRTLEDLATLGPSFMTVTCGAAGGNRENTVRVATMIARELKIPSVAHVTCTWADRPALRMMVDEILAGGISGVMALRGDPPRGETFSAVEGGFAHASDLVKWIREEGFPLSLGVAGYPERHPDSPDRSTDLKWLKYKVDQGANFIVTQMFFDNQLYFDFVAAARDSGISVPILPGVMPISNFPKLLEFCAICGTSMPAAIHELMGPLADDREATLAAGADLAAQQIRDLIAGGAPGAHIYVLNQAYQARRILDQLSHVG
jgi:methylenetetrahydrofolate reductase (NADPH)